MPHDTSLPSSILSFNPSHCYLTMTGATSFYDLYLNSTLGELGKASDEPPRLSTRVYLSQSRMK